VRSGPVSVPELPVAAEDDDPVADAREDRLEEGFLVSCVGLQRRLPIELPLIQSCRDEAEKEGFEPSKEVITPLTP
jgi:hypothetical protein